ncbi:MAG: aldo/keto reductase, partial [Coriobacteriales bacterium]
MIIRQFQGEDVSLYGMGCMRLPKLGDGTDDSAVDEAAVQEMVDLAFEQGVNYFDTAWGYHNGVSEQVMGRCLAKHPRSEFFLADKFPGYDSANWGKHEEIFAQQLQRCQVDYFDFYLVHNLCEANVDAYLDEQTYGILPYLLKQKENGRIRHLGVSVHAEMPAFQRFMDAYGEHMEFCQIQLNYLDLHFQRADEKLALLEKMDIPVWVMEPLRGGKLANLPETCMERLSHLRPQAGAVEWAVRFLQSFPQVTTVLSGASTLEQMKQNIQLFSEQKPLDERELSTLQEVAEMLTDGSVPCTACHYCTKYCPKELDIPG